MSRLFEAKPYIVAEVGSNWQTLEHAIASIGAAKAAGADCVKFQAFNWESLYGPDEDQRRLEEIADLPGCPTPPMRLPLAWLPALREKADACGIDFACTAFSPELVTAVDPFVDWHKVASSDCMWPQLIDRIRFHDKPAVISVGARGFQDVQMLVSWLGGDSDVFLYCEASYPARMVDLTIMEQLRTLNGTLTKPLKVGFSDHTRDIIGHPVEAARRGAVVIEKHFTAFPELDTPDRPHSLTPDEFRTMVEYIRGIRKPCIGPTPEEKAMLLRHNRRLIATRDVAAGTRLTYGNNFGAYRSLKDDHRGLSPFAWQQVEGTHATKAIARGDGIGPGDFA